MNLSKVEWRVIVRSVFLMVFYLNSPCDEAAVKRDSGNRALTLTGKSEDSF